MILNKLIHVSTILQLKKFLSVVFCVSYYTMNHTVSHPQMPPDITLWLTGSSDWMLTTIKMKLTIFPLDLLIFLEAIFQRIDQLLHRSNLKCGW